MARKGLQRQITAALDAHQGATDAIERLDASRRIREAAEELETLAVQAARDSGATWTAIGERYGLTKQGAQQRFRSVARQSDQEHVPKKSPARKASGG